MLRRSKTRVILERWLAVALAVVMGLGSLGVAYADMRGSLVQSKVVNTSCCCNPFTWALSNDDGAEDTAQPCGIVDPGDNGGGTNYDAWGSDSSDDPSEPQTMGVECARWDKDVARTTTNISEERREITVLVENAYPSYYPTVFFGLKYSDSAPGTVASVTIDNPHPEALTVTCSGFYPGQQIPAGQEVWGAVHVHVEQTAAQNSIYTFKVLLTFQSGQCGTAYAYYRGHATCFLCMGFSNWGWSNGPLGPGSYKFQLWAGAAGCDISKGRLVGQLSVDYNGSTAVVTYKMYEGNLMKSTQLYVGRKRLPVDERGRETISPGQYPYIHDPLNYVTTDSYTVKGLSGKIYVVAHTVVCWS